MPVEPPTRPVPGELAPLVATIMAALEPVDMWLFGSRARGNPRPDSDWDLVVVLGDDAPEADCDPRLCWHLQRQSRINADVVVTRRGDLEGVWGVPNTIGFDLAREGVRLDVHRAGHR
jgi:predicted nucleotidyltransferase